jgi:hypothetical protein
MTFLGMGLGLILAVLTQPLWNRSVFSLFEVPLPSLSLLRVVARDAASNGGRLLPESFLHMGEAGAILSPVGTSLSQAVLRGGLELSFLGLYFLAFTSYPSVSWPVPIIASIPFGTSIFYSFASVCTYLVTTYRPIAASALASNAATRSIFSAVFPLFAGPMYNRLGTVAATALLAGIMTISAPLPFIFRRIGPRLRAKSRFADPAQWTSLYVHKKMKIV